MKTKDEILTLARDDISHPRHRQDAPLWLEVRKLEVLIDLRDIIEKKLTHISLHLKTISEKA